MNYFDYYCCYLFTSLNLDVAKNKVVNCLGHYTQFKDYIHFKATKNEANIFSIACKNVELYFDFIQIELKKA